MFTLRSGGLTVSAVIHCRFFLFHRHKIHPALGTHAGPLLHNFRMHRTRVHYFSARFRTPILRLLIPNRMRRDFHIAGFVLPAPLLALLRLFFFFVLQTTLRTPMELFYLFLFVMTAIHIFIEHPLVTSN